MPNGDPKMISPITSKAKKLQSLIRKVSHDNHSVVLLDPTSTVKVGIAVSLGSILSNAIPLFNQKLEILGETGLHLTDRPGSEGVGYDASFMRMLSSVPCIEHAVAD
jgi:hypothetical protein